MKRLILIVLLLPVCLLANESGGSRRAPQDERQAQEVSRAVRSCMQKADQLQLMILQMRAAAMATEVSSLCASGRELQAHSLARRRIRQLERDPLVKQIRNCSGLADHEVPADTDFCAIDLQSLPVFP